MCGIVGFNWKDSNLVQAMAREIAHRGPDQQGHYVDDFVSLGHQRLSILDLSEHGRQPMTNQDCAACQRKLWVVYNGEIYNFKDVRAKLETKGHRFFFKLRYRSDSPCLFRVGSGLCPSL